MGTRAAIRWAVLAEDMYWDRVAEAAAERLWSNRIYEPLTRIGARSR